MTRSVTNLIAKGLSLSFSFAPDLVRNFLFVKLLGPLTGLTGLAVNSVHTDLLLADCRPVDFQGSHVLPGDLRAIGAFSDLADAGLPPPTLGDYLADSAGRTFEIIASRIDASGVVIAYQLRATAVDWSNPPSAIYADDFGSLAATSDILDFDA